MTPKITDVSNQLRGDSRIMARAAFALQYCLDHNWPTAVEDLTWEQIMEIRKQDGWKTPT